MESAPCKRKSFPVLSACYSQSRLLTLTFTIKLSSHNNHKVKRIITLLQMRKRGSERASYPRPHGRKVKEPRAMRFLAFIPYQPRTIAREKVFWVELRRCSRNHQMRSPLWKPFCHTDPKPCAICTLIFLSPQTEFLGIWVLCSRALNTVHTVQQIFVKLDWMCPIYICACAPKSSAAC